MAMALAGSVLTQLGRKAPLEVELVLLHLEPSALVVVDLV